MTARVLSINHGTAVDAAWAGIPLAPESTHDGLQQSVT